MGAAAEYDTKMASLAAKHFGNEEIMKRIADGEAREALADMGISVPMGMEVSVVANTNDVFHVVMPADPNASLSDEELLSTSGGFGGTGAGGTTGTADAPMNANSTAASVPSCVVNPPPGWR